MMFCIFAESKEVTKSMALGKRYPATVRRKHREQQGVAGKHVVRAAVHCDQPVPLSTGS